MAVACGMTSIRGARSHRELAAWRGAVALAEAVSRMAGALPAAERFGLGGRLRRAAGAVPVSIAAGHGSDHRARYLDHLSGALGSLADLQMQLIVVARLGYADPETSAGLDRDCGEVRRQLGCLVASLHLGAGQGGGRCWREECGGAGSGSGTGAGAGHGGLAGPVVGRHPASAHRACAGGGNVAAPSASIQKSPGRV